ncbi:hypothetical protein B0T18DRAFT_394369 [Schizothecium vesticola]|uniref:Glycoside hydrolase family 3 C-terminal domain-containing protein n=1 Tax=Schizothecium vesticola TaxID=314040 RepID=A0AA40BPI8_9PEZI|nr:hypothetical protein B0T18DRAFT_394369 [Schizothecium vesticola]
MQAWHHGPEEQGLAEYHMPPSRVYARDTNVGSFLCWYNAVNGVPSCGSKYLLQTVLREHWNWTSHNNYIASNYNSCECSGRSSDIKGAVNSGALTEATMNRALTRQHEGLVRAGYFDGPASQYASLGTSSVNTPVAKQLALQAVIDSIVILKNNGTLPIKAGIKVAMVGFWADDKIKLRGSYSSPPPYLITPVAATKDIGITVNVANDNTDAAVAAALPLARNSPDSYPNAVQPFGYGLHYTTFKPSYGTFSETLAIADLTDGCKE